MKLPPYDRTRFVKLADIFAVLLAISLPWSTSATGVLAVLWLLSVIPALEPARLKRIALSPAGSLPLLLVALGAIGMLWADVTWAARFNGVSSFLKLLCIPLLMCQFVHSDKGRYVLTGFLGSCLVLLAVSWVIFVWPVLQPDPLDKSPGVPVKDYISQGVLFTICMSIFLQLAWDKWHAGRRQLALVSIVIVVIFLANVFYIATSRTSLVIVPIMLVVFGYRQFGWKGILAAALAFLVLGAAAWPSASYLRLRVTTFVSQIETYQPDGESSAAGERLVFWTKSIAFIKAAPVIGHGTGTIKDQFNKSVIGRTGMAAEASANPHNQIFAVGIQLGFIGIIVLLALWLSHLALFRVPGMAGWIGSTVVIQNIVGSQFNSHLFDFTQGWIYVVGVGIAGGVVLKTNVAPGSAASV